MRLSELCLGLDLLDGSAIRGDPIVTGVASHSASVRDGHLFVAIRGTHSDGHAFVTEAAARGACCVIVEDEKVSLPPDISCLHVADARKALAQAASAFYRCPADRLRMVGVTGTVGKTSTALTTTHLLRRTGMRAGAIGSLGIDDGESARPSPLTTPDPVLLHRSLNHMERRGIAVVTMEVSSHALVQERVHGIGFETALFTNLLPLEHSDFHDSFRSYAAAKARLLEHLRPDGFVVYNRDDPRLVDLLSGYRGERISFGRDPDADVRLVEAETGPEGSRLGIAVRRLGGKSSSAPFPLVVECPLLGRHNVQNALAAVAVALSFGVDPEAIRRALPEMPLLRRRMEVRSFGDFTVLDDTVGHPESIDRMFETVLQLATGSLVVLTAVRGNRGVAINAQNAKRFASWHRLLPIRLLIVTESADTTEAKDRVEPGEARAFLAALDEQGIPYLHFKTLREACNAAVEAIKPGEMLILAGAQGMDLGASVIEECLGKRRSAR